MLVRVIALALLAQAPLHAQTAAQQSEVARGYAGVPSPAQGAVDAQEQPVTQALNGSAAAASTVSVARDAAAQAQYDADRQAYMDALVAHDRAVVRTDARYARQQGAYADAMAVWRVQVQECKKGHRKACDMPAPNPADYY